MMKKNYLEAVIEIVSLAEDVITSSVVGTDNCGPWSSAWFGSTVEGGDE